MLAARQWLLAISTLILAIAVSFFVFGRGAENNANDDNKVATVEVDLDPLLAPIASLEESLGRFSSTLQRFNTTIVQYDFLQKDIERISNLEQAVGARLNLELQNQAQLGEETGEEVKKSVDETITQLREFQQQIQKELEQRRQMMMQLIAGLEKELSASSLDENAVREAIGDTPIPATPNLNTTLPPVAPPEE